MWQRDIAIRTHSWGLWLAVAVTLHVLLLVVAARWRAVEWRTVELVRVALLMGGGGDKRDAAASGESAPPPAAAAAAIAPPVEPRAAPAKARIAPPRIRRKAEPVRDSQQAVAAVNPGEPSAAAAAPLAGPGTSPGSGGSGGDGGAGSGSGTGDGPGTGTGDQRGYCIYCPEPGYPMIARRRGWSGRVDVELVLLADGRVDSAGVMRSSGYDVLDREALEVARRSRFRLPDPGRAPVRGHIEYRFELTQ